MTDNNELAVIICNWNKKDYVLSCINSVLNSSFKNLTVYIIDNASSDGSAEAISNQNYPYNVHLICNSENLGGSGGFNTGIRIALEKNYKYVMLLDNDVILDKNAIKASYEYLINNLNTDVIGSKLMQIDNPDRLQEMGARIDWNKCINQPLFAGIKDNDTIPEIVDCDYVPACSVLIRSSIIRKVGLMDESNFIYWDDIEWFYRMKQSGARIIAYGHSMAWHKMGVKQRTNTFGTYYFQRNRIHFFLHHLAKHNFNYSFGRIFEDLFQAIFFSRYKKQFNTVQTLKYAINDGLSGVRGTADKKKILTREAEPDDFKHWLKHVKRVILLCHSDNKINHTIIERIKKYSPDIDILLYIPKLTTQTVTYEFDLPVTDKTSLTGYKTCQVCKHIVDIRENISSRINCYIDAYFNVVITQADRNKIASYDKVLKRSFKCFFNNKNLQLTELKSFYQETDNKRVLSKEILQ